MTATAGSAIGAPIERVEAREKATGAARYAFEHTPEAATYLYPVQSTIAKGRVIAVDARAAEALSGVLAVLWHENAPRMATTEDPDTVVLQSPDVAYHGQFVAAVVAESLEVARQGAALVRVSYDIQGHDVILRQDHPGLYQPDTVNAGFETDTASGDFDTAFAAAPLRIDATYTTPPEHNNPLEPHATVAHWRDGGVTLYDANQGPHGIRDDVAKAFGIEPERVRVISPHVGGGFGSKAFTHGHVILTVMAAKVVGRPVKFAVTRQQMFAVTGYRTPTIQRVRLGAGRDGRLHAIAHDVAEQTSTLEEFAEQTAVPTRMMYAAPNRRTSHRLVRLDVPTPSIMRAPGECPGMYALESAMDEMARDCDIDPIEFRVRNEPGRDPETHRPFSSRGLVACLREGAERFGWTQRGRTPTRRRDGRSLVGTGVAASTYPTRRRPSGARIRATVDGAYIVEIDAIDIGTGTWTTLAQIAADTLDVPFERVQLQIGDSNLVRAPGAGGSMGVTSWGTAIVEAAERLRSRVHEVAGALPPSGIEVTVETERNPHARDFAMHAYGAQFAEVRVDIDSYEIRVPRLLGVFAAGRIINPITARSQLIGGMTMGLSMALFEESIVDAQFGHFANHDIAEYHIATNADVADIEATWIDEEDRYVNPMGAKGIGELGITGTAAAIANALYDATGVRLRGLPLRLDPAVNVPMTD